MSYQDISGNIGVKSQFENVTSRQFLMKLNILQLLNNACFVALRRVAALQRNDQRFRFPVFWQRLLARLRSNWQVFAQFPPLNYGRKSARDPRKLNSLGGVPHRPPQNRRFSFTKISKIESFILCVHARPKILKAFNSPSTIPPIKFDQI